MSKNILNFKTLTLKEQEGYYDTLWHWIFSDDKTYDLYKHCRETLGHSVPIEISNFFSDYCEMLNQEAPDEVEGYESAYEKELKEYEDFKSRGNTDKKDMDIINIISKVKPLYEGRDDADAEMVRSLLMMLCASNGMEYPNDETEVDYLLKNIKFGGI
ncbi:hypothetical protein G5B47_02645 [Paenibacillus sp. 7124]|uniref:Uncharacterized protein n=1 Tax=Paenibacillus apii TaxID=1850370 RepID=A0A6M1PDI9_9BACL|nr:hypothetical protein [Paenibacillus apii]NGM81307.1 hypothetical protein [Paenibacillus apii]